MIQEDRDSERTTHFGFQTVLENEKASLVRHVFDNVAGKYDLMNDLMSGGIHRLWKDAFVDWLNPRPNMSLLDVGGGTGDIAFRFRRRGGGGVTVCDINPEMIAVGRDRALDRGMIDGLNWVCGDAENLPVPDSSVDAYTIAFLHPQRHPNRGGLARSPARSAARRPVYVPGVQPSGDSRSRSSL